MAVRVALCPLVFLGCLVFVFTQSGVCPPPSEIPELCTANCTDRDCVDSQLCCGTNCFGVLRGRRCADPVPPTTSTTASTTISTTPRPRPSTTTTPTPFPSRTCATVFCPNQAPLCCLRSVQCPTTPCPPQPECVADPCRGDPCIGLRTCIRDCEFCGRCTCIPSNPCAAIRCLPGSECDPQTGQCIPSPTAPTTLPPLTCANALCAPFAPWCCLTRVQCITFPCPRQPQCVADPCMGDSCIDSGTCIRDCELCERCTCISRNPCDTIRCPYGSECDPRTAQCIQIDICQIEVCPGGSVCDPRTGICNNICNSVGRRYVGLSKPFCLCGPGEVCLGGNPVTTGLCCKDMSLPTISAAYKPTAVLLPVLTLYTAFIFYVAAFC